MFLVSRRQTAPVLEPIEAPLNYIATLVAIVIDNNLTLAILSRWDDGDDATFAKTFPDLVAVITFIASKMDGPKARTSTRDTFDLADVHKSQQMRCIMFFSASYLERYGDPVSISSQMYLRTEAAPTAPERARSPFFPPAACWWARMIVLSTQCMSQSRIPLASVISRSCEKMKCHVPFFCQR